MYEDYDKDKFHGNIATRSKCEYSWNNKELCFHQTYEIVVLGIDDEFIIDRDFEKKDVI